MQLLAVWMLSDWMTKGQPPNCQLVELGPGRGTLLKDILRVKFNFYWQHYFLLKKTDKLQVFSQKNLSSILKTGLSLHLVEASPALSAIQERTLQGACVVPVCLCNFHASH